jgi:DNA adenine methylase
MKYIGSKHKIAKHILPTMLSERKPWMVWVEPFVGGANLIDKVQGRRIGNDIHRHLIAFHKALQMGWKPPTDVSKDMYYEIKKNQDKYPDELVGFVGFLCSFGGRWWGGYAKNSECTNYAERGSRLTIKQSENLKGVEFVCGSYFDMKIPKNSLIYCDPPYEGTTRYKDAIIYKDFYQWCRDKAKEGHIVFVSGYNAPDDFDCIKTVSHTTLLNRNIPQKREEKLFRYTL